MKKSAFVLVHGAWHGAWCWERVTPLLQAAGHTAHAVTLTGVGERAHLLPLLGKSITLQTHIDDVLGLIAAQELDDIVLAVHSYGGMVGTGVADQIAAKLPQVRIRHICYIDAVVPEVGESWGSAHSAAVRGGRLSDAAAHPHYAISAPKASVWGLSDADAAWVQRRMTPQPATPYTDALQFDAQRVAIIPRTYLSCTAPASPTIDPMRARVVGSTLWGGAWLPNSRSINMATGHDAMVSAPQELVQLLLACA
jgi:pimeloyl-ACP methyl ester carboxylesterase